MTLDADKEQATLTVPSTLPAGKATLSIRYTGILNNRLRGFYLSKGDHRNYAVTQFESTDARRAFPSFDEPAFKATYDISLIVDADDTAISNSPIESDIPGPGEGKHTLKFLTTPENVHLSRRLSCRRFPMHFGRIRRRGHSLLRHSRQGRPHPLQP